MIWGYVVREGMPRAWIFGYKAEMIKAVEEVGSIPVELRVCNHSTSVLTPVPFGPYPDPKAVPSSVLVPMSSGTRTKLPEESCVLG